MQIKCNVCRNQKICKLKDDTVQFLNKVKEVKVHDGIRQSTLKDYDWLSLEAECSYYAPQINEY